MTTQDLAGAIAALCVLDEMAGLKSQIRNGLDAEQRMELESAIADRVAEIRSYLVRAKAA